MISTYQASSRLNSLGGEFNLNLETALAATPLGYVTSPQFFTGFLARPEIVASCLLAVADVAATRYVDLRADAFRSLDPVVTASGDRLRFESFSADNGVYARVDLLSEGIESGVIGFGTTNIDINRPLRDSLSRLRRNALVHVAVGPDALTVSTIDEHHVEREVQMPDRWVRAFAETSGVAERMVHRATLAGSIVAAFLSQLPKGMPGPTFDLVATSGGLRKTHSASPGSLHLAGTSRLSSASRIARYATSLEIFSNDDGASCWVFALPGARLSLLLSPASNRGFSGEGGLLTDLSHDSAAILAEQVNEHLAWEPTIDPGAIASAAGLSVGEVRVGISHLATSGKIGFDLTERAWFHRELPLDPKRALGDNPRLVAAKTLVQQGNVKRNGDFWAIHVGDHVQYIDRTSDGPRCTCQWWAKYGTARGLCKHLLAVEIMERS